MSATAAVRVELETPQRAVAYDIPARLTDIRVYSGTSGFDVERSFWSDGSECQYPINDSVLPLAEEIHTAVHAGRRDNENLVELRAWGETFRTETYRARYGNATACRRMPKDVPRIDALNLPRLWADLLLHPSLCQGGLVIVMAPTGAGKSVTLAGTLKARLEDFGGEAQTLEDPIEQNLEGRHGHGICHQTEVGESDLDRGWDRVVRSALRRYGTSTKGRQILMVGEVRDSASAAALPRVANAGHLVLTTLHAKTIRGGISRLISMASKTDGPETARDLIASALRMVVTQSLEIDDSKTGWARGSISGQLLFSKGEESAIATMIRDGNIKALSQPIDDQKNVIASQPDIDVDAFLKRCR